MPVSKIPGAGISGGSVTVNQSAPDNSLVIDSSGNAGFGISSVAASGSRRTVQITNGSNGGMIMLGNASTENPNPRIFLESTNDLGFASGVTTGVMKFYTNDTERMRITSDGNLLIASGFNGFNARQYIVFSGSGSSSRGLNIQGQAGTGQEFITFANSGGGGTGSITQNSGGGTNYNTSSDYRLKENITPMAGALAIVQQLKPCSWTWKIDGSNGQGFIAHELQKIVPECVVGEKDAVETYTDEEGNEQTRPVYQGVDTSFLVATLTAAIQELKAELDATKAEVQALKGAN